MATRELTWKEKLKLEISASLITLLARIWFGTVRVKVLNQAIYEKYFKGSDSRPCCGRFLAPACHLPVLLF